MIIVEVHGFEDLFQSLVNTQEDTEKAMIVCNSENAKILQEEYCVEQRHIFIKEDTRYVLSSSHEVSDHYDIYPDYIAYKGPYPDRVGDVYDVIQANGNDWSDIYHALDKYMKGSKPDEYDYTSMIKNIIDEISLELEW